MAFNLNELFNMVAEGEHDSQDFKIGTDPTKENDVALDISVFANAAGGVLIYGVNNDGELVGCTYFPGKTWRTDGQEALQNSLAARLRGYWPVAVKFELDIIDDDDKRFIILTVPPSTELIGYRPQKNSDDTPWQHWKRSGRRKTPFSHSELLQKTELERNRADRRAVQSAFLELINPRLIMLGLYISTAYGKRGQTLYSIDDELAGQLTEAGHNSIRESASELFNELKGLAFLGLNLDDEVKNACLALYRTLREFPKLYSIWSSSQFLDQSLASWRQGIRDKYHIAALYRDQANSILIMRERFIAFYRS